MVSGPHSTSQVLHILTLEPSFRRLEDRGYSLCWEDHQVVSGRSFYLPGSVDKATQANLDQWNKVPPPLYLWSHNAFYEKHMQIAQAHGHQSIYDPEQVRCCSNVTLRYRFSVLQSCKTLALAACPGSRASEHLRPRAGMAIRRL